MTEPKYICCVCAKPWVHVSKGGDGITVLVGENNEPFAECGRVDKAHYDCAMAKSLRWFGMGTGQ